MAKNREPRKKADRKPEPAPALVPQGYEELLGQLKERIRTAQLRAALAVNRELVLLYWQIGREILLRQKQSGWGAKVIDRLAADLRKAFPGMEGFSPRNLKYMRAFARAWPVESIVQQAAAQLPWFHNCVLLDKVKDPAEREWYVRKTLECGRETSGACGPSTWPTPRRSQIRHGPWHKWTARICHGPWQKSPGARAVEGSPCPGRRVGA